MSTGGPSISGVGVPQQTQPKPTIEQATTFILPAGNNSSPPLSSRVAWTSDGTASGALIADVFGYSDVSGQIALVQAISQGTLSGVILQALDAGDNIQGELFLEQSDAGGFARLQTTLEGLNKTILASDNSSGFLQGDTQQFSTTGQTIVTWPGTSPLSNPQTISLPGASGTVVGTATCQGLIAGFLIGVPILTPVGGGDVQLQVANASGGSPGAGTGVSVSYILWGS